MYAFTLEIPLPIEPAIDKLKEALATEKMGVVSEVNVQALMKAKLDQDIPPYRLIGICGPGYAHRVLQADADLGAMLPCGCAMYETNPGTTRIAIQDPDVVAGVTGNAAVKAAMAEARSALERIIGKLGGNLMR
jgi:uncharacterized protein (DUF302 family)